MKLFSFRICFLTFCLNCLPPQWYLKLLKTTDPSAHSTILLHASEILICLQAVNFFLGAFSHSLKKKTFRAFKLFKPQMRTTSSEALLWNGNICERDSAPILPYGWPFSFACAQLHVLPSPDQGMCSCFVIPHLSQLCNASSSPCQPIAIKMETAGKCKADRLRLIVFSYICSFFSICTIFLHLMIYCKACCDTVWPLEILCIDLLW